MRILLHHNAGSQFDALAERLVAAAGTVAPLVEAVTGLALPRTVVLRTMTVRGWQTACRRWDNRRLREETAALSPSRSRLREAKNKINASAASRRILWPTVGSQCMEVEPGAPEVVILPQSQQQAGQLTSESVLLKVVAHEMTHLAQYAVDNGAMRRQADSLFPEEQGTADLDHPFLLEGHAYWADRHVTGKLLGDLAPTGEISPHATFRYRNIAASPQRAAAQARWNTATECVAEIIAAIGVDTFNRVWTRPELVPRTSESGTPELWRQRFAQPPPPSVSAATPA